MASPELRGFHQLWTKAVGQPDYDKQEWLALEALLIQLQDKVLQRDGELLEAAEIIRRQRAWKRRGLEEIVDTIRKAREQRMEDLLTCVLCKKPKLKGFQVGPDGAICMECVGKGRGVPSPNPKFRR